MDGTHPLNVPVCFIVRVPNITRVPGNDMHNGGHISLEGLEGRVRSAGVNEWLQDATDGEHHEKRQQVREEDAEEVAVVELAPKVK